MQWTPKAEKEFLSWFPRNYMNGIVTRPVYRYDFDWTNYAARYQLRCLLGFLSIRELPFKDFFIKCSLAYDILFVLLFLFSI